jgi:mono/diheme cytochrome c family protein
LKTNGSPSWKNEVRVFLVAGASLAAALGGFPLWYQKPPETPQELFRVRCSTCHARPDLSGYCAQERPGIVMTMLRERGADKVITPDEAAQIIGYITAGGAETNDKDKGDGDT